MRLNETLLKFFIKHKLRGKDRLFSLLVKLGFGQTLYAKAKYGLELYLNPNEYIDNIIIREGFYESEVTEEILSNLEDGETFWDIGANIGIHGMAIKKMLPQTNVYCFEPNPRTLSCLYNNVNLNNLPISICCFALFDSAGSMLLYVAEGNSGMSTLTPWHETDFSSTINCLTTTGDNLLLEGYKTPNVIKLDTEGSELNILKGCKNILKSISLKIILFEAANDLLENSETNELVLFLQESGFNKIKPLIRKENTHHNLSNFAASR